MEMAEKCEVKGGDVAKKRQGIKKTTARKRFQLSIGEIDISYR